MPSRPRPLSPVTLPLAALLVALPPALSAQALPVQRELPVASGQRLQLELDAGGSVRVVGRPGGTVRVVAREGARPCTPECRVEVERTAEGVRVRSRHLERARRMSSNLQFEIEVPPRFDLEVRSTGGGLSVENLTGELSGQTMGGDLDLRRVGGTVTLKTMGGAVRVADSRADGKVETMGGNVTLTNVSGGLDATTMGGTVTRGASTSSSGPEERGPIRIRAMGGDIELASAPRGADLETMGGDITLGGAGGPVRVRTMGGEIRLDAVDGSVHATTMGGDVRVSQTGDPARGDRSIEISSMGGDIEVVVPAGSSLALDLELAYTRGHEGRYRILSDFPVRVTETPEWDRRNGSARRSIRGVGEVAGGRNRVRIRTINGNIRLHRAQ